MSFWSLFFPAKNAPGLQFPAKAYQSDLKIDEKSTSEPDFPYFGEALIFDDSIMVLLDFTGPDKL